MVIKLISNHKNNERTSVINIYLEIVIKKIQYLHDNT